MKQPKLKIPENMRKVKLTLNKVNSLPVDIVTADNIISQNSKYVKCSIQTSEAIEQTDYFIFKSKHLVFKIKTRISNLNKRADFLVKRYEADFYCLRSILSLCYGQCFIPPLWPKEKEVTWDKKSIALRERTFSRFLRGIVRSKTLASHPLVYEFLKVDHHSVDRRNGMRNFSKELQNKEAMFQKMSTYYNKEKMSNGIYRITSVSNKISLKEDFTASLLDDRRKNHINFNEKKFV